MLGVCQQVAAIPSKRAVPAETHFLERDEIEALLKQVPLDRTSRPAGPRPPTVPLQHRKHESRKSPTCGSDISTLGDTAVVRLHGKGDKWRTCPLWRQTNTLLTELLEAPRHSRDHGHASLPCRRRSGAHPFGIYKDRAAPRRTIRRRSSRAPREAPHLFRHTAAVHMLEGKRRS